MYPEKAFEEDVLDVDSVPERTQSVCSGVPSSPAVLTSVLEQASVPDLQKLRPVRVPELEKGII